MSTEMTRETEGQQIKAWLAAGAFLTLPSLFILLVYNQTAFFETYILYVRIVGIVAAVIAVLSMIIGTTAIAMKKRLPKLFEAPPAIPDWSAGAAATFALMTAIFVGASWGTGAGVCVFWPSAFVGMTIAHVSNWAIHQLKRWWE